MGHNPVLVVDDNQLSRDSLCEVLGELDCRASAALDGLHALALVKEQEFGLIFNDVDMPGISGFELLARLRQQEIHTPVVIMSARAADLEQQARQSGAIDVLAKPFTFESVSSIVERIF